MNNSDELSLPSDIVEYEIQTSPIHSFILRIDLREVIFHNLFSGVDIEDVVESVPSFEFLIMIDFRRVCKVYIIDELLSVMSYAETDWLT